MSFSGKKLKYPGNLTENSVNLVSQKCGHPVRVELAENVELEEGIEKEKHKLEEIRDNSEYNDGIRENIRCRIAKLNDNLSVRQESIDLLNGRLKDQIASFKEMIAKVLSKDTSLAEKIQTLLREQRITIASILMDIGMAISVLVEAFASWLWW